MWEGGEVWILGGGPSLIDCFNIPSEVVNSVRTKKESISAYSPYLAAIHNKHVIGINVAYQFGKWLDICFFGDKNFFLGHKHNLANWGKLTVTCSKYVANKDQSWIKYLPAESKKGVPVDYAQLGISSYNKAVCWNWNSGGAAISLAAWLGVKRIVLVGFDMTLSNSNQHFHNEYIKKGTKLAVKNLPFSKHLQGFPFIKADADRMGIEIINTSLNSAIQDFPKVHIKELL
jgi:hypothetical protein